MFIANNSRKVDLLCQLKGTFFMASMKELLQQDLQKAIAEYGPDSRSAKDLRTQLASLEKIRTPSELAVLNSSANEQYHGATLNRAPSDAATAQADLQNLSEDPALGAIRSMKSRL